MILFRGSSELRGYIWWVVMVTLHEADFLTYYANGFTDRRQGHHP